MRSEGTFGKGFWLLTTELNFPAGVDVVSPTSLFPQTPHLPRRSAANKEDSKHRSLPSIENDQDVEHVPIQAEGH